jgi:iron complex outermembrane receptor protein
MNLNSVRKSWVALALCISAGLPYFAVAQTAATTSADASKDQPVKMEKFVVTGSYIPVAADAIAIPVVSVDVSTIEHSGVSTNVLDMLRKAVPQFMGNANIGTTNGNVSAGSTNGGSMLALRNASTLVLLNGRRSALAPVSATGGYSFVDVNLIPLSAIQRIEILADGASAIYGTDAVAGVVNIILKTDFEGAEIGARYGWSTNKGNFAERSGYIIGGGTSGKTNVTFSAEWQKQDPLYNFERPFSDPTYGTQSFGGSVNINVSGRTGEYYALTPGQAAPPTGTHRSPAALVAAGVYQGPNSSGAQALLFNLSTAVTQLIGNERQALTMAFDHKVNDQVTAFGDFQYSNTKTYSSLNGQPFNAAFSATDPMNPFDIAVRARNRFVDHPRTYANDTTGIRGVAGLRGTIGPDWTWETAADYNRITQDYVNGGLINTANRITAVADGTINMFAVVQAPGAIEASGILGKALGQFISTLANYDARVTGKLFDLPGGPLGIAAGVELRKEAINSEADVYSQNATFGWDSATTIDPFAHSRQVKSIFGEVRIPVVKDVPGAHMLEVSAAVRHEDYSDTSNPTVPKFTFRYLPFNDEFALRGTYSKSFSAPTLFQLFGPGGVGFSTPFTLYPHDGSAPIQNLQTNARSGANSGLEPSKSKNYTLGFVYSPKAVKGFSVSVDYWDIKQRDLISSIGTTTIIQSVEDLGPASPYSRFLRVGSFTGPQVTAPGQVKTSSPDDLYVTDTLVNIAGQSLAGWDVALRYSYTSDSAGRFDIASNIGIYSHYRIKTLPDAIEEQDASYSSFANGTLPKWSTYTSVTYSRGQYEGFVGLRYLTSVTDIADETKIPSFYTIDFSGAYTIGSEIPFLSGMKVGLGVSNVFNKMPPKDATIFTDSNADIATYGSVGRFIFVDLKYKF